MNDGFGQRKFTGLLDRLRKPIFYGDRLRTGMRRGDENGWSIERVEQGADGQPCLADLVTGERSQMQWDQELRELPENRCTAEELVAKLERLDDDLLDPDYPIELVERELRDIGLDPDEVGRRGVELVERLKKQRGLS